jgi:hypothetical protein
MSRGDTLVFVTLASFLCEEKRKSQETIVFVLTLACFLCEEKRKIRQVFSVKRKGRKPLHL